MVMAQALFKELARLYPKANIDVLAPDPSRPLLSRMPEVNQALNMPLGHGAVDLKVRWNIGRSLRAKHYDWAILLPNTFKSALVPLFAGIPRRTGWRGEMRYLLLNDLRVLDETRYRLMVERFVALAHDKNGVLPDTLPKPKLLTRDGEREAAVNRLGLEVGGRPVLALCPGAEFGDAKRWPGEKYAELAAQKIAEGWQVWLLGSPKDRAGADDIYHALNKVAQEHCANLCGQTSLTEVVDIMSLADAVVSNDSGLMHIAASLNRPLVVIYGSTSPKFTPPLSERVEIVSLNLDCSPCFKRECPLGHTHCLKHMPTSLILDALSKLPQPTVIS